MHRSLSVERNPVDTGLSPGPSLGRFLCLSGKCTVAKWLNGSGCNL